MNVVFDSRIDAADRLAEALYQWRGRHPLILAIPRGAVPMGRVLAESLGGELDVVLVRKLRAPFDPELAVGAIDENGWAYTADHAHRAGADCAYLEGERARQLEALRARRARYTPNRRPIDPAGRIAIVVDDGVATGATMIAALHAVRARGPGRLICAVPVASRAGLERVGRSADEVICLESPQEFRSVGQFYREFPQVDDDTVAALLAGERQDNLSRSLR